MSQPHWTALAAPTQAATPTCRPLAVQDTELQCALAVEAGPGAAGPFPSLHVPLDASWLQPFRPHFSPPFLRGAIACWRCHHCGWHVNLNAMCLP